MSKHSFFGWTFPLACQRKGKIAWNNKWHSWVLTTVLKNAASFRLEMKHTAYSIWDTFKFKYKTLLWKKSDRSINVWIKPAYQCSMKSKKLCAVSWEESPPYIKHIYKKILKKFRSASLPYYSSYSMTNKHPPSERQLGQQIEILCIVCNSALRTMAGFKMGER